MAIEIIPVAVREQDATVTFYAETLGFKVATKSVFRRWTSNAGSNC
jgi:catechol 2,3-dioxygenase-like lactoylglutathione lyase family enzyme